MHRVLSWLAPLVLLGCRSAEPVEAWCSDPVFDDAPWVSEFSPCPEHTDSLPEAEKVGECGRFDMLWWAHPTASTVYFQARSDGSLVGVRVDDREYGRLTCERSGWDCITGELVVVSSALGLPICDIEEGD